MDTSNEAYLKQKLEWVKYRLSMLDEIEPRLTEMRSIATAAENSSLSKPARMKLNDRLRVLEKEVHELDNKSRTFWMDCQ